MAGALNTYAFCELSASSGVVEGADAAPIANLRYNAATNTS